MALTYWKCGKCLRVFTVTSLTHKHIKNSHQAKPFCHCGSIVTEQTHKERYEKYLLDREIKRDNTILKSLDVWYKGGTK